MKAEGGRGKAEYPDALWGMMAGQYAAMRACEQGVGSGSVEAVHDLRVAIRRLRTLLRAFRKPLAGTAAKDLEPRLQRLSRALGPVRDADIWLRFLASDSAVRPLATHRAWAGLVEKERAARLVKRAAARRVMDGAPYRTLRDDLERFLRAPPPVSAAAGPRGFAPLADKALARALGRVAERSRIGPCFAPGPVHRLRIVCRRARYVAEFVGPVLGARARRLGRQMKAMQDVLGDLHDRDVCSARLRRALGPLPASIASALAAERLRDIARFRQAWKRLPPAR